MRTAWLASTPDPARPFRVRVLPHHGPDRRLDREPREQLSGVERAPVRGVRCWYHRLRWTDRVGYAVDQGAVRRKLRRRSQAKAGGLGRVLALPELHQSLSTASEFGRSAGRVTSGCNIRSNHRIGVVMAKLRPPSSITMTELLADYLDERDEEVMQALVTAGALVALADGRVETVERDELVNYIHRQGLVPTISQQDIAETFDSRVRQLEDRDGANVIMQTL